MPEETHPAAAPDIDWTILAPLIAHVVFTQAIVVVVRVTVSYRAIELEFTAPCLIKSLVRLEAWSFKGSQSAKTKP